MNDWDTIEKILNTLPQWDIIKWIMGIQEELKGAKEDNLYQLRQNKNLQSKIDKAIELGDKIIQEHEELVGLTGNLVLNFKQVLNILKEDK